MINNKLKTVRNLVSFEGVFDNNIQAFQALPLDYEDEALEIKKKHVVKAIDLYMEDQINAQELEKWADALEISDYVNFENNQVHGAFFTLSSPEINLEKGKITKENAQELKTKLMREKK